MLIEESFEMITEAQNTQTDNDPLRVSSKYLKEVVMMLEVDRCTIKLMN